MVRLDRVSNALVVDAVWASPLVGQLRFIRPELLDVAWIGAQGDEVAVRWAILAPLLVGTAVTFAPLALLFGPPRGRAPTLGAIARGNQIYAWGPRVVALILAACAAVALRGMYLAEEPRYRQLASDLAKDDRASGYVFSNWANEASFLNLNRSPLPGLGLPDGPRLTKRMQQLLRGFEQRTRPPDPRLPRLLVQVAQVRPGDRDTSVERWLADAGYPLEPTWYGTIRLNRFLLFQAPAVETADVSARFGDGMKLEQARWSFLREWDGDLMLPVSLRWSRLDAMDRSYHVLLQLVDDHGTLVAQSDGVPMAGTYPTTAWGKRDLVADNRLLAVGRTVPSGEYRLTLAVTYPGTGRRLPLRGAQAGPERDVAILGSVHIP
jgi:hypothetical protein